MYRIASLVIVGISFAFLSSGSLAAEDKDKGAKDEKNVHYGTFVSAKDMGFKMKGKDGKEHAHSLSIKGKVMLEGGKEGKLADLKAGQFIRVTTASADPMIAEKVEVVKKKESSK